MMQNYDAYDATGLAELIAKGDVSATELLNEALARTAAMNPGLTAIVHIQTKVAQRLITEDVSGPFTGVPFLMKDLGAEAVDFPTHSGSHLFADTVWGYDSAIYKRMRATGMIPFARTTSPEAGIGPVTEAAIYGAPTRNPWDLTRTSGGSSGGSGAAVAAGIVPMAHGSDGGGSVRIPASSCGLFGFKATRARFPDGPMTGEGWGGMAIDGFLSRSVRDNAAMMDACAGSDLGAPYVAPMMDQTFMDAIARPPKRLRIGVCDTTFTGKAIHPDCRDAVQATARMLETLGHSVEPMLPKADHTGMMHAWTKIVACGTALTLRTATRRLGRDLQQGDVQGVARGAMSYAEQISGADYLEAVNKIHAYGREMAVAMQNVDVLVSTTLAEPPAVVGRFHHNREDYAEYRMGADGVFDYSPICAVFNASGQPAASIPLHWSSAGLPIGVHLAASFGDDALLIALCAELETAMPWVNRKPPLLQAYLAGH
ncbi:MAG: amidase [Aliishimia sp.]